jgi:predicted ATP-binding protein involved in virulence
MENDYQFNIRLEELETAFFRGVRNPVSIPFHPNLTAIVAINGAGKTTILEAVAGMLQVMVASIKSQSIQNINGFDYKKDIHNGAKQAINTLKTRVNGEELQWTATLDKSGYQPDEISDFGGLKKLVTQANELIGDNHSVHFPILAYYPFQVATVGELEDKELKTDIFQAYDNALSGNPYEGWNFFEWFKGHERRASDFKDSRRLVQIVQKTVYLFLSDEFSKFDNLKTDQEELLSGELVIFKNGDKLKINQLSAGEKTLFSFVTDLARRLALLNPSTDNPLEGNGIVLIDEIDLHLHPAWHRTVLPKLRETFPNIQFIITTHSPFVLQSVPSEHALLLKKNKRNKELEAAELDYEYGSSYDTIVEEVFGIKADFASSIEKSLDEFYKMREEILAGERKMEDEKFITLAGELAETGLEVRTIVASVMAQLRRHLQKQVPS